MRSVVAARYISSKRVLKTCEYSNKLYWLNCIEHNGVAGEVQATCTLHPVPQADGSQLSGPMSASSIVAMRLAQQYNTAEFIE